jgi:WD40 repeat protein
MDEVKTITEIETTGKRENAYLNPFPGLRPFGVDEYHLFFGREGQSEEVLQNLVTNRFVIVTGPSGSGKSSLIYCGLIPLVTGGLLPAKYSEWIVMAVRPGSSPIENLAKGISNPSVFSPRTEKVTIDTAIIAAMLRRSSIGLLDTIKQSFIGTNILLVIDQFEELFRYGSAKESRSDAIAYAKLLVEAVKQEDIPIYLVITMRSDFVGECSQFQELTGLINKSNYLIPQMTRENCRQAIEGPVAVGGATIDIRLVDYLLNDVGDNTDKLPVLQHALMRTWDYWCDQGDNERPISFADYDAVGKMEKALSKHADEAWEELDREGKRICEAMFKVLTEKGTDLRGIRRPVSVREIILITRASLGNVVEVIEKFREFGRSFLLPSSNIQLTEDTIIDLSHESLMRIWERLKTWVDEESVSVHMYKRLSEAAALYQAGKGELWSPPDLLLALSWERKQKPTLEWARRYNPAFERTMSFLHNSERKYESEEAKKYVQQKRMLARTRLVAASLGAAAVIAVSLTLYFQMLRVQAENARKEAYSESKTALEKKKLAEQIAIMADEQRKLALRNTYEAIQQKDQAYEQKSKAEKNVIEVFKQSSILGQQSQEINEKRKIAELTAQDAIQQRLLAENAQKDAFQRRMLSLAQSMSTKSLQIEQDDNLKGLLAYQAWLFNEKYGGVKHQVDIYSGLYNALKSLSRKDFNVFKGHKGSVNSIVFAPEGDVFYSAGSDGRVFRWKLSDLSHKPSLVGSNGNINRVLSISYDGNWLACGTDGSGLQLFDVGEQNNEIKNLGPLGSRILSLAFFPDNRHVLSYSSDNIMRLWDIQEGTFSKIDYLGAPVLSLSVSRDGKNVVGGTRDGKIILWDIQNNFSSKVIFDEPRSSVFAVSISHNGKLLASGDINGNLKLWSLGNGQLIISIHGHSARIVDVKFSPNDKLIASSSYDNTALLWAVEDFNLAPIQLKDHVSWVLALAFSTDGNTLMTGSNHENYLIAWPTKTSIMAGEMCRRLSRNFTSEEWEAYIGKDVDYEKTCK